MKKYLFLFCLGVLLVATPALADRLGVLVNGTFTLDVGPLLAAKQADCSSPLSAAPTYVNGSVYCADRVNFNPSSQTTVTVTASTIAFTTSTITDSGNGFGSVLAGDYVKVTDASGSNSGTFGPVHTAAAGTLTFAAATFTAESAGNSITLVTGAPYLFIYSSYGAAGSAKYTPIIDERGNVGFSNFVSEAPAFNWPWNNAGSVLPTTYGPVCRTFKFAYTITGYRLSMQQSSQVTITLKIGTPGDPANVTTDITGTHNVTTVGGAAFVKADDTLTDWTTTIAAGKEMCAELTANDNAKGISLILDGHY